MSIVRCSGPDPPTAKAARENFKAVILLSGSGLQDRDETIYGHKPFKILADHLTRQEIAVLRYDDRGFGKSGRVIAADLQEEMLQILKKKIQTTEFEERITLHKSGENKIGLTGKIDFALVFYVIHELPGPEDFFKEIVSILKPGGQVLIVEPPFHVSKTDFLNTINMAENAGLRPDQGPRIFFSKTAILKKG